ncbi:MAG: CRISPR-associated endonuclease Cas2 [Methanophagales archaeon]|nr:CRISPR-associated endonuclease Cas2 [Methanophagales archaeon]
MYVIIVYDVEVELVDKVRKFLRMYLHWRQNSVFEGEVSDAQLAKIRAGLKEIADEKADSVILYKMKSERYFETELIGIEKSPMGMIL